MCIIFFFCSSLTTNGALSVTLLFISNMIRFNKSLSVELVSSQLSFLLSQWATLTRSSICQLWRRGL